MGRGLDEGHSNVTNLGYADDGMIHGFAGGVLRTRWGVANDLKTWRDWKYEKGSMFV